MPGGKPKSSAGEEETEPASSTTGQADEAIKAMTVETHLEVKVPYRTEVMKDRSKAEKFVFEARQMLALNIDPRVQSYEVFFPPSHDLEVLAAHVKTRDFKALFEHIVRVHQIDKRMGMITDEEDQAIDSILAQPKAFVAAADQKWDVVGPALAFAITELRLDRTLCDKLAAGSSHPGVKLLEKRIVNKMLAFLPKDMKQMFMDFVREEFKLDGDPALRIAHMDRFLARTDLHLFWNGFVSGFVAGKAAAKQADNGNAGSSDKKPSHKSDSTKQGRYQASKNENTPVEPTRAPPVSTESQSTKKVEDGAAPSTSDAPSVKKSSGPTCHKCGQVGHIAKECSPTCHKCGQVGHIAKKCPSVQNASIQSVGGSGQSDRALGLVHARKWGARGETITRVPDVEGVVRDHLECKICFSTEENMQVLKSCGHVMCVNCVNNLRGNGTVIVCPFCNRQSFATSNIFV